jgi:hypothetical protein
MKRNTTCFAGGSVVVAVLSLAAGAAEAQLTLYEHADYRGGTRTFARDQRDLASQGFNDKASSFRIESGTWELCIHADYRDCRTFRADEGDLARLQGWNDAISSVRRVGRGGGEIEVFDDIEFEGRSRAFSGKIDDLRQHGWNDRISSVVVRGGRWQICRHSGYRDCREVDGDVPDLRGGGWNDAISSLRPLRGNDEDDDDD